jgi:hypothetical protein
VRLSTAKRPFLRQEWLAEWFGTYQELISRWQGYVVEGGLEKLNGEYEGWVVTSEIRQAILDIWTPNFWLSATEVHERLLAAGHISSLNDISAESIRRVAEETGLAEVRRLLRHMFEFTANGPEWRDDVLIERLFELNAELIALLQAEERLTPQLMLEVESLKQGLNVPSTPAEKGLPYAYQLQRALFGQWEEVHDGSIHCPHCGSDLVRRKEHQPRRKKYCDPETGKWREVKGYRCFCLNPDCEHESFTSYPDDVRLYSSWTIDTMIWGVMVYMRLRTTYRLAAEAVGVSHVTLWRWAMAKKTVNKRYRDVMALQAQRIFDFLERHYVKLVNAISSWSIAALTSTTRTCTASTASRRRGSICICLSWPIASLLSPRTTGR